MKDKIMLNEAIQKLEEKKDTILDLLHEMESVLKEVDSAVGYDATHTRAEAYWLTHIRSSLSKDLGNPYDTSADDTIKEVRELAESAEVQEEKCKY